jgi:hypothetical protein
MDSLSLRYSTNQEDRDMTTRKIPALTKRLGKPPITGDQPPHLQFSDQSPRGLFEEMEQWALVDLPAQIPFIRKHPTLISVPTSQALWLDESKPARKDAFMPPALSREFAHLHADGSWHLVVAEDVVEEIISTGWGERHPWYDRGVLEVMVYAPRDEAELQTVKQLVVASIEHAANESLNCSLAA